MTTHPPASPAGGGEMDALFEQAMDARFSNWRNWGKRAHNDPGGAATVSGYRDIFVAGISTARATPATPAPDLAAVREVVEELERLEAKATKGPWAWDARGEKTNEWGLGVAFKDDDSPYIGHFRDSDAIYVEYVCSHEAATCNYSDPDLICALRNHLPLILAALKAKGR